MQQHRYASQLNKIPQEVDLNKLTRMHNISMNGHVGHGRNMAQATNFGSMDKCQPNGYQHGWGLDREELKQGPELQRLRVLPADQ